MKKIICFLLFLLCIGLSGCENKDVDSANEVAYKFIECFKTQDFKGMYSITNDMSPYLTNVYNPEQPLNVKLFKALGENMEYTITKTEIKGDEANVFYHLRTLDAERLMAGIVESVTENPQADVDLIMEKQILLCPRIEKDTVLNMDRLGDTWVIESNIGIYDDLCGGFIQFSYNAGFAK